MAGAQQLAADGAMDAARCIGSLHTASARLDSLVHAVVRYPPFLPLVVAKQLFT